MRRFVFLAVGVAAAVAGVAIGVIRSRGPSGEGWRERLMRTSVGLPSGPLGWVFTWQMAFEHRRAYATMARELDLQPDDDLLDVGCGSAAFLQRHAAHVRHVAGLDASEIPVGMARQRLADRLAAGTAEIVLGDAMAMPWPDNRFSIVTAYVLLEYVPDPLKALSEMHRVLRPGGRAVLSFGFPIKDASLSGTKNAWGLWRWSEADARRLMEEAGFGDVAVSPPPTWEFSLQLARGTKQASPLVAEPAETPALAHATRG
jgi:ubiquinone/menaquinone biosynthesis C-methylase UbiE